MNAPETLTETISRHFDDANDPAQTAMLSEQIATDPEAAISFARAARVHGMLQQSLAPAVTKSGRWKPLLWIGSAAAVVIGSFLTWKWAGPHEAPQTKVRITHITDEKDEPKETLTKTIGKVRRVKPATLSANAPDAAAKPVDLNNYFVDLDIHGMTVENALASLKAAISEVNYYQRSELERLEFSDVHHPATTISSFLPRNSTVPELWKVIKTHSFFRATPVGSSFSAFSSFEVWLPADPGVVETREFRVPPNFVSTISQVANLPQEQRATPGPLDVSSIDWKTLLGSRFGIPLVDGESVDWNPPTATMTIKADTTKLNRFASSLGILNSSQRRAGDQLHVSQLVINCAPESLPAGFDQNTGMLMDPNQFAAFKDSLADKGSDILASPQMLVRDGQRGQISVENEIPHSLGLGKQVLWVGHRSDLALKRRGELISCVGQMLVHLPPLDEQALITQSSIRKATTEFETYIPYGQTALFTIDAPGEKRILLCCLTVRKSVLFEKLKDDQLPFGTQVPGKAGFVYSPYAADAGEIDVRGLPSGTKVECPYTQKIFRVP